MIARVYGLTPGVRARGWPALSCLAQCLWQTGPPNADVLVMQSKFDAEAALALIEKHRITNAVMVPTMFIRMLKLPQELRSRYDVSSLNWVTHTGAPCPPKSSVSSCNGGGRSSMRPTAAARSALRRFATPQGRDFASWQRRRSDAGNEDRILRRRWPPVTR